LRERGIDAQEVAERQLAGGVGEWAPDLAAVLFDENLRPSGLWEWRPRPRPTQDIIGRGWLVQDGLEFLAVGTRWSETREVHRGVVGILDGCWSQVLANRVPDGTEVNISPGPAKCQALHGFRGRRFTVVCPVNGAEIWPERRSHSL